MKKTIKKLAFKVETLKQLDASQLKQAVGGITGPACPGQTFAYSNCATCYNGGSACPGDSHPCTWWYC